MQWAADQQTKYAARRQRHERLIAEREERIAEATAKAMDHRDDLIAQLGPERAAEIIQAEVDELFN